MRSKSDNFWPRSVYGVPVGRLATLLVAIIAFGTLAVGGVRAASDSNPPRAPEAFAALDVGVMAIPAVCTPTDVTYYDFTFGALETGGTGEVGSWARYTGVASIEGQVIDMYVEVIAGELNRFAVGNGVIFGLDDAQWQVHHTATLRYSFYATGTTNLVPVNAVFTVTDMDGTETAQEIATFNAADLASYAVAHDSHVSVTATATQVKFAGNGLWDGHPESRFQFVLEGISQFVVSWEGGSNSGFGFDGNGDLAFDPACEDFGDAPDIYGTSRAANGARHIVKDGIHLGAAIDFEPDGVPSAGADSDDNNWAPNDEDGIAAFPPLSMFAPTYSVTASCVGEGATVAGWIDFNGANGFEAGERAAAICTGGSATLTWAVPGDTVPGETYARFRIASNAAQVVQPTGPASDGEVEDYRIEIIEDPNPGLEVTKFADADAQQDIEIGQTVTYTIRVTNTGNVPLAVTVTDPMDGLSPVTCEGSSANNEVIDSLAPGQVAECTATYVVVEDDVGGGITNTATATGCYEGDCVDAQDSTTVPEPVPNPGLAITKVADDDAQQSTTLGQVITYTMTVRNTGNVTLRDVRVTDDMPNLSAVVCEKSAAGDSALIEELTPGEAVECTATYVVADSDILNGTIENTASVAGCFSPGVCAEDDDTESLDAPERDPGIEITKVADEDAQREIELGQVITYTFTVTNTGNLTFTDVEVQDGMPGLDGPYCENSSGNNNVIDSLAPGETVECTATYQVEEDDVGAGSITNSVTASGCFAPAECVDDTATEQVPEPDPQPSLEMTKVADDAAQDATAVGQVITYTMTVTNTGNVSLFDVEVTDAMPGLGPVVCEGSSNDNNIIDRLGIGEAVDCVATYEVQVGDADNGPITNTASVNGCFREGECAEAEDEEQVPEPVLQPGLELTKVADDAAQQATAVGQVIRYTLTVANTGNLELTDVAVTDGMTGLGSVVCENSSANNNIIDSLAPGEAVECTASYVVQLSDVDTGTITNTASVSGCFAPGVCAEAEDTEDVPAPQPQPGLELDKVADDVSRVGIIEGQVVTYTFHVANVGNVPLTGIEVLDDMPGLSAVDCGDGTNVIGSLAPGASRNCTATYVVTAQDAAVGFVLNQAVASACYVDDCIESADEEILPAPAPQRSVSIRKRADRAARNGVELGQTIVYSFQVTNTGNVTLSDVAVTDPLRGLSQVDCGAGSNVIPSLRPGASRTCTATYVVQETDVVAGQVVNTASVSCVGSDDCVGMTDEEVVEVRGPVPTPTATPTQPATPTATPTAPPTSTATATPSSSATATATSTPHPPATGTGLGTGRSAMPFVALAVLLGAMGAGAFALHQRRR